jgi:hypothetical protein
MKKAWMLLVLLLVPSSWLAVRCRVRAKISLCKQNLLRVTRPKMFTRKGAKFQFVFQWFFILGLLAQGLSHGYAFSMGYHYDLIREAMRQEGFGKDAFSVALAANSYTDIFQEEAVEWVIDDDFCRASKRLVDFLHFDSLKDQQQIDRYWRQLIHNAYNAVTQKAQANDRLGLLMIIGVTMHIVQDFYAHSNWVELDLPRHAGVKDATYFDVRPEVLGKATQATTVYGQRGLFTHGAIGISHDTLHKDHAGKPYFDWAYRCAYKASLQWLRLIRKWIVDDLRRPDLWNDLLRYQFTGNRNHLYTLTNFDEGTIRWLCTYGGAWKTPRRWSRSDILADDMPNVPGIGATRQGVPFLGNEWFANCALVAKEMFEARASGGFVRLQSVDTSTRRVTHAEVPTLSPLDNNIIRDAFAFLAGCASDYNNRVRWLRVRIPEAQDLDTGEGAFNVNNEEPGGTSDYWVMFILNNETEHPYTEAEYVDNSHPYPVWGVLKPLWDSSRPVRLQVRMYESVPTNHKDEEMDIRPGTGKDFTFEFDPTTQSYGAPLGCRVWQIPSGYFIRSEGEGDLRARVYVKIWVMGDLMDQPLYPLLYEDKNYDGLCLPVLNDREMLSANRFNDRTSSIWIPPQGWTLQVYEHSDYRGASLRLTRSEADLHSVGWEDRISSIKVVQRPSSLSKFAVLWADKNCQGVALQLFDTLPNLATCGFYSDLSAFDFNDKASSIEVPAGWTVEVYEHPHFEGRSLRITSSVPDLHALGWGGEISSVRVIPSAARAEQSEQEAILRALREALKRFPDEDPMGLGFSYKRADVRFPSDIELAFTVNYLKVRDGWAWIEVTSDNYVADIAALLRKDEGRWRVKGIVNPAYFVCPSEIECLDVFAFLYRRFMEKIPTVPREVFPEIDAERAGILRTLRSVVPLEKVVFLVRRLNIKQDWAWIETHPRTPDGMGQFEPVSALLQKEHTVWRLREILLHGCEDENDDAVNDKTYIERLLKKFPFMPREILPDANTKREHK